MAQQPAPRAPKVLVFPFAAIGDEARVSADLFRKNLINQIDLLAEVDAIDPVAAEAALGKTLGDARDGCGDDDMCTTALARAVGARYLVKGGLLVNAGAYTLSLQLFDADAGRVVKGPESKQVANEDAGVQSMRLASLWLFGTTALLALECDVPGADVFLDSKPLGKRTPIATALTVPVPKVSVRVEAAGYEPFSATVDTRAGQRSALKVTMKKKPQAIGIRPAATPPPATPLLRRPLFWGAVAAGAAVLAGGVAVAASQDGGTKTKTVNETGAEPPPTTTINSW